MTTILKPFAFVLMPFDRNFDDIYKLGIKETAMELGIIAERIDEQRYSEAILERIYRQIRSADFIVADMTGRNPNVFYEVGYSHAVEKPCILLTQAVDDIPFDLKHHRHLVYDGSIQKLQSDLRQEFAWHLEEFQKRCVSALTMEIKNIDGSIEADTWRHMAEVNIYLDIHNYSERRSPEIEAIYLYTSKGWRFRAGNEDCPSTSAEVLRTPGLRHLIKSPVSRLSPKAWAQVPLVGKKEVWNKFNGTEKRNQYRLQGSISIEIATSEGTIAQELPLDVTVDDLPF